VPYESSWKIWGQQMRHHKAVVWSQQYAHPLYKKTMPAAPSPLTPSERELATC